MNEEKKNLPATPLARMDVALAAPNIRKKFEEALADSAPTFMASITELYKNNPALQECQPTDVIAVVLSAATLKLPINKALGYAWVVPYKKGGKPVPEFQVGYKGYIQLAIRTGLYRYINAGKVYEGELAGEDKLSGSIDLSGKRESDVVIGYFAHLETLNGFKKTVYSSVEGVEGHRDEFAKGHNRAGSVWNKNFDAMAEKTMLRKLLSRYGIMSIEQAAPMARAFELDEQTPEGQLAIDIEMADGDVIDIDHVSVGDEAKTKSCPERSGDQMNIDYCEGSCDKREGCPSWADAGAEEETAEPDSSLPDKQF